MTSLIENADYFKSLHKPYDPLFLYNIWDAGSAKAVISAGAKAIATSSWSVAAAQGYDDGEELPLEDMLNIAERIARSVKLPLTVDFEGGYAIGPEKVAQNVEKLLKRGVVGFNFEDQIVDGEGLYSIDEQVERIGAARRAANALGIPAFINARTDVFLKAENVNAHAGLVEEALAREKAYALVGADGFFVPGLTDKTLIKQICASVTLPVNIMVAGDPDLVRELSQLGVSRVSLGPVPYIDLFATMEKQARRFF
ncbi:isocitrate lyase/phosphoenolpyruvate mutase family protein [Brucellaceae bacterium C25G]